LHQLYLKKHFTTSTWNLVRLSSASSSVSTTELVEESVTYNTKRKKTQPKQ